MNELEGHYLAGGNVDRVVTALISADRANIDLPWQRATAIDLAGRDVLAVAQTGEEGAPLRQLVLGGRRGRGGCRRTEGLEEVLGGGPSALQPRIAVAEGVIEPGRDALIDVAGNISAGGPVAHEHLIKDDAAGVEVTPRVELIAATLYTEGAPLSIPVEPAAPVSSAAPAASPTP